VSARQGAEWPEIAHRDLPVNGPLPAERIDAVLDLVPLAPGARVVDVGCGRGETLARLAARRDVRATGVDLSPVLLTAARGREAAVEWVEADAGAWAAEAEPADLAISISEALHSELRPRGVTATAVCPGPVESELWEASGGHPVEEAFPRLVFVTPEQVATAAVDGLAAGKRVA